THGSALDVPAAVEDLDGASVDPSTLERLPCLGGLDDARRVGHEDPAGLQHALSVRDDLPRLGEVEDDTIERAVVDALVAVAELDSIAIQGGGPEEAAHVRAGAVGEVLAELVAD